MGTAGLCSLASLWAIVSRLAFFVTNRIFTDNGPAGSPTKPFDQLTVEKQIKSLWDNPAICAVDEFNLNGHLIYKSPCNNEYKKILYSSAVYMKSLKNVSKNSR